MIFYIALGDSPDAAMAAFDKEWYAKQGAKP